jgi:hypothetical protein
VIEDCPYARIDYHNNLEIPIPPGSANRDIGLNFFTYLIFVFYDFKKQVLFFCANHHNNVIVLSYRCGTMVT